MFWDGAYTSLPDYVKLDDNSYSRVSCVYTVIIGDNKVWPSLHSCAYSRLYTHTYLTCLYATGDLLRPIPSKHKTFAYYLVTIVQCWTNVEDSGPTLYKCYANVLRLLGGAVWNKFTTVAVFHDGDLQI